MSKVKNSKLVKRPKVDNSRKAQRKQKRLQKKVHRQEHYLNKKKAKESPKYVPGKFVRRPVEDEAPQKDLKKKKSKLQPTAQDILNTERNKDMREANKLKVQMDNRRKDMLVKANQDEDKLIKKLEKQLGLNKSKNKNNFFSSDGLDYVLEICDRSTTEQIVAAEKHLAEVDGDSDFDEDLATVTGKDIPSTNKTDKKSGKSKKNNVSDDESGLDDDDGIDSELSEVGDVSEDDDLSNEDDDNISDVPEDKGEESDVSEEPEEQPIASKKSKKVEENEHKDIKPLNQTKTMDIKKSNKERIVKADELKKIFSDDEISHLSGDDNDDDLEEFSGNEMEVNDKGKEKPDVWEDIYGRKRDEEGNVIKEEKGVYIPPHLRNKDSNDTDKQMVQLKRQIQSVLNKLAGTNLHWACSSIESLYAANSRHSVNAALSALWLEATVAPAVTPDRLLTEHSALIAVLHANVGSEIGAHFLQELAKRFDQMTRTEQPLEDKRLDNLVACLALLYSFKIYEWSLVYELLSRLVSAPSEKHIGCTVTILRQCGAVLRKESPARLRQFVHDTHAAATALDGNTQDGTRIKFLLEVLMAIKNNNLTKIPNYDPSYQEHLRKATRSIVRKGNYVTPLNIGLEDLLKADERGKWWVVGSAWEGQTRVPQEIATAPTLDHRLLQLARKQRMNTDLRRNVFCLIMAAEDYMDAFEKLQHLGVKGQQEREIIHVLMACCLQEKTYNPYYGVLAQKLCDTDRKYQLSIQFAVWDKIKDIQNQPKQCLSNLAQFLTHLIMEKGLPLSVLKVIEFSDLNKHTVRFMRKVLLAIIMNADVTSSLEVFHRISKPPKLHMFRESLKLFIQHFLVKSAGKKSNVLSDSEMVILKERVVEVNKILTLLETKLKF